MDEDDAEISPQRTFGYAKIVWEVENCFCAAYKKEFKICSPEFSIKDFLSIKWQFILISTKISDRDEYITSIRLERLESGDVSLPVRVYWNLSVSRGKESVDISAQKMVMISAESMVSTILRGIKEELQQVSTETLNFESLILVRSTIEGAELVRPSDIGLRTLSQDIGFMCRTNEYYDLGVHMRDRHLKAHKAILTTANKTLRDAVGRPNYSRNNIHLASSDAKSMGRVFRYWYTGNLSYILRAPSISIDKAVDYLGVKELQNYFGKDELILRSTLEARKFYYKWEIAHFFSNDNSILSPFFGDGNLNMMFRFRLELKNIFSDAGYVNIFLEPIELSKEVEELYVIFDILDSSGNSISQNKGARWLLIEDGPYKLEKFLSGDISRAVDNGVLRILCKFYIPTGFLTPSVEGDRTCFLTYMDCDEHYDLFSKRMRSIFESGHFCDLRIKCGNEPFFVHKCVLSVRSPVFAETIRTLENSKELPITDVPRPIMEIVLYYIYTGLLRNYNISQVPSIYFAAAKFGMLVLKYQCVKILIDNLQVSNAFDFLFLAHTNGEPRLKFSAFNCILSNIREIRQQDSWEKFWIQNPLSVEFKEYVRRYARNNPGTGLNVEAFLNV